MSSGGTKTLLIEHDHSDPPTEPSAANSRAVPPTVGHESQRTTVERPIGTQAEAHGAQVFLERCDGSQSKAFHGQLRTITPGDLRIGISTPLPLDNASSLRIRMQPFHFDLTVWAELCSCRAAEGIRWELDCALDPPLPREALRVMGTDETILSKTMKLCTLRATACADDPDVSWPVRVEAIGQTGMQIAVAHSVKAGTHLELEFEPPDGGAIAIAVETAWQLRTAEHFVLGVLFNGEQAETRARELVKRMGSTAKRSTGPIPIRPSIGVFGSVAVVALLAVVAATFGMYATADRKAPLLTTEATLAAGELPEVATRRATYGKTTEPPRRVGKTPPYDAAAKRIESAPKTADRQSPAAIRGSAPKHRVADKRAGDERLDIDLLHRKLDNARRDWQVERQRQQAELAEQSRQLRKQAEELAALRAIIRREHEVADRRLREQAARLEADRQRLPREQVARSAPQPSKPAAKRSTHPAPDIYRVWSAAEGGFQIEAAFVSISRGIVRLKRPDGRRATIALEKLAPADQQLVRSLLAGAAHGSPATDFRTR